MPFAYNTNVAVVGLKFKAWRYISHYTNMYKVWCRVLNTFYIPTGGACTVLWGPVGGRALSRVLYDKIYAKPNNKQNGCFLWHEDSVCICVCVCVYVCVCMCVSEMLNYKNNKTFNWVLVCLIYNILIILSVLYVTHE